jgi:Tol biopolymer transport system component
MRKLTIGSLVAMALLLTAAPSGAKALGTNGQLVIGRFDPLLDDTVLYTVNPDGSHEHQLLSDPLECPHWSPDGGAIVTCGNPSGGSTRIIDPDTGTYRDVTGPDQDTYFMPCMIPSPDFSRLACEGFGQADESLNGIYTLRTSDGGDLERVTSNPGGDDLPGDYSPDGNRLVFVRDLDLFIVKTNGTGLRRITPSFEATGSLVTSPGDWSPRGNQIVISRRPSAAVRSSIWVVHNDGSGLRKITVPGSGCGLPFDDPDAASCLDPQWSPDGTKIAFKRSGAEGSDLYTINADGSGLTQVTHDGDIEFQDWGTHPLAQG